MNSPLWAKLVYLAGALFVIWVFGTYGGSRYD